MRKTTKWSLLVVAVLVVTATAGYFVPRKPLPWRVTFQRLWHLGMGVRGFRQRNGRLPSVEELVASMPPFMRDDTAVLDGWRRKIIVLRAGETFVFVSKGSDGVLNTRDDMVWVEETPRPPPEKTIAFQVGDLVSFRSRASEHQSMFQVWD